MKEDIKIMEEFQIMQQVIKIMEEVQNMQEAKDLEEMILEVVSVICMNNIRKVILNINLS